MAAPEKTEAKRTPHQGPGTPLPENHSIALCLQEYADLLEQQGEDGFRQLAYRRAAETLEKLERPVGDIFADTGHDGLVALPTIGRGIASAIVEMLTTGRWSQLERLKGELSPDKLFQTLPGVGPALAHRFADDMELESLEELEAALHDPEVKIEGIGPRRRTILTMFLADRLGRRLPRYQESVAEPPVNLLLEVDAMYRERAEKGLLRKIAPKRFNPDGQAWLPIMHARHDAWHFTALFSNTQRAHELDKTDDWVVIYFHLEGHGEGRSTVVTETRGENAGKRVVRGREEECKRLYD